MSEKKKVSLDVLGMALNTAVNLTDMEFKDSQITGVATKESTCDMAVRYFDKLMKKVEEYEIK